MAIWIRVFVVCLFVACSSPALLAEEVRWRMNILLHPQLFGQSARVFAGEVYGSTTGAFNVDVQDQLVLDVDAFEAPRLSLVDAIWGTSYVRSAVE